MTQDPLRDLVKQGIESLSTGPAYQWTDSFELWHGWPSEPSV